MKNLAALFVSSSVFLLSGQTSEVIQSVPYFTEKLANPVQVMVPANDNCASATTLTVGGALLCGQTTSTGTLQVGECYTNYGGGSTEVTTWYRFTATNDSLVFNWVQTNSTNCAPHIAVYGPFASGAGCLPACATQIYNALQSGDPGHHNLLTGLSIGSDYLIQIQGDECGGAGAASPTFCINVVNPAANAYSSGATMMNACGTAFSGTTNGGYWNNGTGTGSGNNNLDNNAGTTCGGCAAGDDVPFVINNISWFTFCAATNGTWQVTVNGISGCNLAAPNAGIQASLLTGTTGSFTNAGNSPSPLTPGSSWTSATITVNSGSCAYLMIDGFAGDACNYSVTLTNVTGGCIVLPIVIENFAGEIIDNNRVRLVWSTLSERDSKSFTIERSADGITFEKIGDIPAAGFSATRVNYELTDYTPNAEINYYRLAETDLSNNSTVYKILMIKSEVNPTEFSVAPNPSEGEFEISVPSNKNGNAEISVTDLSGKKVIVQFSAIEKGNNKIKLNASELDAGLYILEANINGKIYRSRVVKK